MYQLVYKTKDLRHKDVLKIFNNIFINSGNKVVKDMYYGLKNNINYSSFLKVKNLLPVALFAETDVNTKTCCLNLTTQQLLTKLYNQLSPSDPGSPAPDNWQCTTLYCTAPQNVYVSYITYTSALVGWDMVLGETYNVYLDDFLLYADADSPVVIDHLLPGVTYSVRISSGEDEICNTTIEFTTVSDEEQPNLIFSWDKDAGEVMNMTTNINGTFTQIDWGDGTVNTSLIHTYTTAGNYTVKVYDSTVTILVLGNKFGPSVYKLTALTKIPDTITQLTASTNTLTSIPSLTPLTNLTKLLIQRNAITTLDISANTQLDQVITSGNPITSSFDLTTNTLLTFFEMDNCEIPSITNVGSAPGLFIFQAGDNYLSVTDVNNALIDLAGNGVLSGSCVLNNQTPLAPPSGAGIAAVATLVGNSWTVHTD